jgi:ribose/xylose/arabinose/galactoside ABC-type transport system permease subunit
VKSANRIARWGWLGFDALVVVVFVVIGRSSHHHAMTWSGFASTTWPFAVGLLIGWVWVLVRGRAGSTLTSGVVVWLCTVVVGMLLRVEFGQGTAVAFIAVALGFLGALMLGARLLARSVRASSSRPI